jgi:hypothetical protein
MAISLLSMPGGSCMSVKCGRYLALSLHRSTCNRYNSTPREALWTLGYPTEDHQIRSGSWNPGVKSSEKKKIYNIL